ncbi:MAG: potassium channel protein [marine bacterium B5-7]|nr:MAG: potassium channel protein [marine bacterium B5-7]
MSSSIEPNVITENTATVQPRIMFVAAVVFLATLAVIVQWWNSSTIVSEQANFTLEILVIAWLPFIVEALAGLLLNRHLRGNLKRFFLVSVLPPLRLGYSTFNDSRTIWLPRLGWRIKGRELFQELDKAFTLPMLVIALMILPILGIEYLLKGKVADLPWLGNLLDISAAFIWFAFTFEYVLMISVADDKIAYAKKNWLNLLIILLPLIAFLRSVQVVRAFRVARAGKMLRVYRLRSLLMRIVQAFVAISAIERVIHRSPEKHLEKLKKIHAEKEHELQRLCDKMDEVRQRIVARSEPDNVNLASVDEREPTDS